MCALVAKAAHIRFAVPRRHRPQNQIRVEQEPTLAEARRFYDLPDNQPIQPDEVRQEENRPQPQARDGDQSHAVFLAIVAPRQG